jgi:hypothetical protein
MPRIFATLAGAKAGVRVDRSRRHGGARRAWCALLVVRRERSGGCRPESCRVPELRASFRATAARADIPQAIGQGRGFSTNTATEAEMPVSIENGQVVKVPVGKWPHIVLISGAAYLLKAPLNKRWPDGVEATHQDAPDDWTGSYLQDPSNAPEGAPARSKNGFPLFWGLKPHPDDMDKAPFERRTVIEDRLPPSIVFKGQNHPMTSKGAALSTNEDLAIVSRFTTAVDQRDENLAKYRVEFTGPISPWTLTDDDWRYYLNHPELWGQLGGGAPLDQVNNAISNAFTRLGGQLPPTNYAGVFKPPPRT